MACGKLARAALGGVTVVLLGAGCSSDSTKPADERAEASVAPLNARSVVDTGQRVGNEPAWVHTPASEMDDEGARASSINVFGEFDGSGPRNVRPVSEAGLQQHTQCEEGYDGDVTADPSGKWLAFSSTRHSLHTHLYLQRVDGVGVTQLTDGEADDAEPAFSPDGAKIAFCSTRAGTWDIFVMDAQGRAVTQVTDGAGQDMHPSFSPDGSRLAYSSLSARTGQWELWTVDLSTNEKRMIGPGVFPSWCPVKGSEKIAFQRARQRGSRWFSVWTLELVDGEPRNVTEIAVSSSAAVVTPTWSPDGRKIAFATVVDPLGGGGKGRQDVWCASADGTARQKLTDGAGTNVSPFWAAGGRIFFVSNRGGAENVWSVREQKAGESVAKREMKDADAKAGADQRAEKKDAEPAEASKAKKPSDESAKAPQDDTDLGDEPNH